MSDAFYNLKRSELGPKILAKGFSATIRHTDRDGIISNETLSSVSTGASKFKDDIGAPLGEYQYVSEAKEGHEPKEGDRFITVNRDEVIVKVLPIQPGNIVIGWTIVTRSG